MDHFNWLFDGIGTELISIVISFLIGGLGGFSLGRHTKSKQIQSAGDKAKQKQFIEVDNGKFIKESKESNRIYQKQQAGNEAKQIQIGTVENEHR